MIKMPAKESLGDRMAQVQSQPTLVEQVVNAIISEIVDGDLASNTRLIQDDLVAGQTTTRAMTLVVAP